MTAGELLYDVRNASKSFRKGSIEVRALDGVDLRIAAGEFVALEGPSGSGKTTLLQLLGALDRPSDGQVFFEGRDLRTLKDRELAELRLRAFGPTLSATSSTGGGQSAFGLGAITARTVTDKISLTAPVSIAVLLVGFGLALAGGLLAGTAGALRAARLRPADALRTVE